MLQRLEYDTMGGGDTNRNMDGKVHIPPRTVAGAERTLVGFVGGRQGVGGRTIIRPRKIYTSP